jgi:hypothetical protein
MADEEIEELRKELKKLKPKDRIKKLKELEERRKDEITEIEDLIKDSEKELKTEIFAEEVTPEHEIVNIESLFLGEIEHLEATIQNEAPKEEEGLEYLSFKQIYSDYSTLKDISYASFMGTLSTRQMDTVDRIGERLDRTKYRSASQDVAEILVASRATLYKIKKYAGLG